MPNSYPKPEVVYLDHNPKSAFGITILYIWPNVFIFLSKKIIPYFDMCCALKTCPMWNFTHIHMISQKKITFMNMKERDLLQKYPVPTLDSKQAYYLNLPFWKYLCRSGFLCKRKPKPCKHTTRYSRRGRYWYKPLRVFQIMAFKLLSLKALIWLALAYYYILYCYYYSHSLVNFWYPLAVCQIYCTVKDCALKNYIFLTYF